MILGPAQVIGLDAVTSSVDLTPVPGILHGWAWRNTSDVARADVELWDGEHGVRIVPITLSQGQSTRDWLSGTGIEVNTGLYVVVVSGSVDVTCWFRPHEDGKAPPPVNLAEWFDALIDTVWGR